MSDTVDQLLNPEVREMLLGSREPEQLKVYPLTYNDQKMIGGKVIASIKKVASEVEDATSLDYVTQLSTVLESNVPLLVSKCTDKTKKQFMDAVTSGQLMTFITIVMEVNFLNPIKRGTQLFVEMGSLYGTNPLSSPSVELTDIGLETSPLLT